MKRQAFMRVTDRLSTMLNLIASLALLTMIFLTCFDIFMRYFFNRPVTGTYDLVSLLGALLASFAMPYTMLKKGHVAVELVVQRLSRTKQLVVETATHLVAILLFLVLVWQSAVQAVDMKRAGEVTPTLLMPFYPIVICMSVGFFVLSLAIIVNLIELYLRGSNEPN